MEAFTNYFFSSSSSNIQLNSFSTSNIKSDNDGENCNTVSPNTSDNLTGASLLNLNKFPKLNKELHDLFPSIHQEETSPKDFSCVLHKNSDPPSRGRLYITNRFRVYFSDNAKVKENFSFTEIVSLEKDSNYIIITLNSKTKILLNAFFGFFDECYQFLNQELEKEKSRPKVFGVYPSVLVERENRQSKIPSIVEELGEYIKQNDLQLEGIFRVNANKSDLENARFLIDNGEKLDISSFSKKDSHFASGLLKYYFRELPEPILTYALYDCFVVLFQSKDLVASEEYEFLRRLTSILEMLPPVNKKILIYLFDLLDTISMHPENKMNKRNLVTVWQPILFKSESNLDIQIQLEESQYLIQLLLIILENRNTCL